MSAMDIEIPHRLGVAGARNKIERLTPELEKEFAVECMWQGDSLLRVSRKGLKADLSIYDDRIRVSLELGFFLKAMGPAIRTGIAKRLGEVLA